MSILDRFTQFQILLPKPQLLGELTTEELLSPDPEKPGILRFLDFGKTREGAMISPLRY